MEEKDEVMENEKTTKKENKKSIVATIFNVIFWVAFLIVSAIWVTDYYKVSNEEEPIFCLSNKTHTFDDGTVEECSGLGYKIYKYNRSSLGTGFQFGPFFVKMRQPE